ncbi:hypothetical protein P7C73_g4110, partial [Tremellales sp. Uapishka_1]
MADSDDDDIRRLNDEADEAYTVPKKEAYSTRMQREAAWRFFVEYFESARAYDPTLLGFPGTPTSAASYLDPSHAPLDYRTCCAFITHHMAGAHGNVEDRPSLVGCTATWKSFCQHVLRTRGEELDAEVQNQIRIYLGEMVEAGHLSTVEKERCFTDGEGLRRLLGSVLSHDIPIRYSRTRLQLLFWMSKRAQTGHRIGADLPNDEQPDSREAQYRDFNLHISRHSDPTRPNIIVVSYEAPNHKTEESRFKSHALVPQRYLALCPVFTFLALAEMDGALPAPLSELLDPAYLGERQDMHVGMADAAREDTPYKSYGNRGVWTTDAVGGFLRTASKHAQLPRTMTAHSFRRMQALFMRASGTAYDKIQRKLNHIESSDVTETYIKQIPSCDVASILFDSDSQTLKLIEVHPNCLRPSLLQDLQLDREAMDRVFANEHVVEAQECLEQIREEISAEHGDLVQAALPPEARTRLEKAYAVLRYRVNALTSYEQAMKKWRADRGTATAKPNPAQPAFRRDETPVPDASDADVLPQDGQRVGYDGFGLEYMISNVDLPSSLSAPRGESSPGATSTGFPVSNDCNDPAVGADDDAFARAGFSQMQASAAANAIEVAAVTSEERKEEMRGLNALERVEALMMSPAHSQHWVVAAQAWRDLPDLTSSFLYFRPSHSVIEGRCDSCGIDLPEEHPLPPEATAGQKQKQVASFKRHLLECHATAAMHTAQDELLRRHGPLIPTRALPFTLSNYTLGQLVKPLTLRDGTKRSTRGTKDNLDIQGLSGALRRMLDDRGEYLACATCGVTLWSYSLLRGHLISGHAIWLLPTPTTAAATSDWREEVDKGEWTTELADFPKEFYFFEDAEYLPDPADYEIRASELCHAIVQDRREVDRWALRPDITLRPGVVNEDLGGQGQLDTRFRWENGRNGRLIQPGICFLCFWDDSLCASERIVDWRDDPAWFKDHLKRHLADSLLEIWDEVCAAGSTAPSASRKPMHHYLIQSDSLACPDPVCRNNSRTHATPLDFVDHLVGVHYLQLSGTLTFNTNERSDIREVSFPNADALEQYVRQGEHSSKLDRQAQAKGEASKITAAALAKRAKLARNRREKRQRWGENAAGGFIPRQKKRKANAAKGEKKRGKKKTKKEVEGEAPPSADEESSELSEPEE